MTLTERVKNILLQPKTEWQVIAGETTSVAELYQGYIIPLAAVGPVAWIIGTLLPGGDTLHVPLGSVIVSALISYVLSLGGVYLVALIIDALAQNFGGRPDRMQALKVVAYASTPTWVAGALMILPVLGIFALIAAFYGLYLLYLGLPVLMNTPREKAIAYTVVVVVVLFVLMVVINSVSMSVMGPSMSMHQLTPPVR